MDRTKYIGGSDVSAICGFNPWKSAVDVFLEKTGQGEEQEDNPAMYWGRKLENAVAEAYQEQTCRKVYNFRKMIVDKERDFLVAHLDRLVEQASGKKPYWRNRVITDTILECKTTSAYSLSSGDWGEEGTDEIPVYYITQCMHYMGLTGALITDVPVLFGGRDFKIYRVERDDDTIDMLKEKCIKFWEDHVLKNIAPPPVSIHDVDALFPQSIPKEVVASEDVECAIKEIKELKNTQKETKKKIEELSEQVALALEDADTLILPEGTVLATRKSSVSRRLQTTELKKENPDIYKKYVKENPVKKLLIKNTEGENE